MKNKKRKLISRRQLLATTGVCAAGVGAAGLGLLSLPSKLFGGVTQANNEPDETYFPPSEEDGGWRVGEPLDLGVDGDKLREAIRFHDTDIVTTSYGGAVVVIRQGNENRQAKGQPPFSTTLIQKIVEAIPTRDA